MHDPVRHVVIDASVLAAALLPQSTRDSRVADRTRMLLDAVRVARWPSIVLYAPEVCVAEVLATFDKYRYCTWYGALKRDPDRRVSDRDYRSAQEGLEEIANSTAFHRVPHDPKQSLAAGLVSPINAFFEDCGDERDEQRAKQPMGASDCLIAGTAIVLGLQLGSDSVVLATADHRLANVIAKAKNLTDDEVRELDLDFTALLVGLEHWSPRIYPRCANFIRASELDLRDAFLGWPLPTKALVNKEIADLQAHEKERLARLWLDVKSDHELGGEDALPYSAGLDDLRTRFACETAVYLPNDQIYHLLQNMRKAGQMSSSDHDERNSGRAPTLFDAHGPITE